MSLKRLLNPDNDDGGGEWAEDNSRVFRRCVEPESTTSKLTKTSPNSKRLTFMEEDIRSHLKVNPWSQSSLPRILITTPASAVMI
jgi:hypothetical protein